MLLSTGVGLVEYGKIIPHSQAVSIGDVVTMTCHSTKPPTWTFKRGNLPQHRSVGNSIIIVFAKEKHTGTYQCKGKLKNQEKFVSTSNLYVACKSNMVICLHTKYA